MKKVLVTGGTGYIGSHTIIDLIENGYLPVSIDNESRSDAKILDNIKKITGHHVTHYKIELCDIHATEEVFVKEGPIAGIIHFAAYKTVPESVKNPLLYYRNNLNSLINLLELSGKYAVPAFIFSSSCSVYGNVDELPVTEKTPLAQAESPYANTKKIGEEIIRDFAITQSTTHFIALRYFNPVGAHISGLIGENPFGQPENLMPVIIETANGQRNMLHIFGDDYPTRDGTCIRDYIHVSDIAHAHTKGIEYLIQNNEAEKFDVLNLGNGKGVTVKELIETFEEINNVKVNYKIGPRRAGDVVAVFSDNTKTAKILNWNPRYEVADMCRTAWNWNQNINSKKQNEL